MASYTTIMKLAKEARTVLRQLREMKVIASNEKEESLGSLQPSSVDPTEAEEEGEEEWYEEKDYRKLKGQRENTIEY